MDNQNQDQNLAKIKLTGLWKKTAKNGNMYLAGPLSGSSMLMVFPNTNKNGERDPDYLCYLFPKIKRDQPEGQDSFAQPAQAPSHEQQNQMYQQPAAQPAPVPQFQQAAPVQAPVHQQPAPPSDADIPF